MSNLIGQSLGRYHILERLGEGGMAIVYKAYDTRLERDVAVKVISVDLFGPAFIGGILKRFEREAKALAKLSHPNIVGVIDYGEHEGAPYLVLEYLPGGTLKQRMGKIMPWQSAVRLLIPIADALQHAHENKVIHRDVKPSNILLTEKGQPMLTDFGIAKILEMGDGHTLTGAGVGIGTPEYMAPEQSMGKQVDGRADIYSLGVVFYELITGRKPYTADTPMAVMLKQMTDPLPHPSQYVRDLPDEVERVLIKALAKDPDDRYPDMDAFVMDLEELQPDTAKTKANFPAEIKSKITTRSGDTRDTYEQADDEVDESTVDAFEQTDETITPPKKQKRAGTQITFSSAKPPPSQGMPALRWLPLLVIVGLLLLAWLASGGLADFFPTKSASTGGTPYIFTPEEGSHTPTSARLPTLTRIPTKPPTSTRRPPTSTPRSASTSTPRPQSQAPTLTLRRNAYCRVGPGSEYVDVTAFLAGDKFTILGWNPAGWWLVKVNVTGSKHDSCWIGNSVADTQGNTSSVPVINP